MKHWLSYDTFQRDKALKALSEGGNYTLTAIHMHPTKLCVCILEIDSPDKYQELDIDCNSYSSPLRYHHHKPAGLNKGIPAEVFQEKFKRLIG